MPFGFARQYGILAQYKCVLSIYQYINFSVKSVHCHAAYFNALFQKSIVSDIRLRMTQVSQQTADVEPVLVYCWPTVCDAAPTLNQNWLTVSYFLGLGCMK